MTALIQGKRYKWLKVSDALDYINQINRELLMRIPQLSRHTNVAPQQITTVAGTREYNINTAGTLMGAFITQVEQVEYNDNATGYKKLRPTSIEALDRQSMDETGSAWRSLAADTPTDFYIDVTSGGVFIGFNKVPTNAGVLKIWGASQTELTAGQSLLLLPTDEVYIEGICYRMAKSAQKFNDAQMYLAAYEDQIQKLKDWVKTVSEGYQGDSNVRTP